ncbi:molybdopterin molybdenumtransferase MoeA [Desulfuromonas versatilis]|uniref:Molybdopterin molybdenumtransferase n=1 Tax=Desulfuromonas versatilis TaxID=2802975 RepID=A0ABN6DSX5_9BACT|nr:gephyrin-like molybdotransferase Glp [Desulfuromonas versatilis]BCR03255.1 molybdopterin molybdenumtransferase MoeA [Desulfuromonas versatilis]
MKQGFLHTLSRSQFQELLKAFAPTAAEPVPFDQAHQRVLAEGLLSPEDLPAGRRSAMDGYALAARDAFGASESNPAYLECLAEIEVNRAPDFALEPGTCAWIPTGGFLPQGADSVVMVEYTQEMGAGTIEVRQSLAPGENVMEQGEDAASGEPALSAGSRLRTQEIGLLAALGIGSVRVHRRPRVGIISTGDELVAVDAKPQLGQIRDVNSYTVACLAEEAGGVARRFGIVGDDLDGLVAVLQTALADSDLVLLSGGSSKGTRDMTIAAIEALPDMEILAHGVSISPGKPTILARVGDKPVVGLPGQVGSAQVVMTVLGQPFIRHLAGARQAFEEILRPLRRARLARNLASRQGREDFVRVRLEPAAGGLPLAQPVMGKSGLLRTLLQSHGLLVIPAESEGFQQGDEVDVWVL